MANSVGPCDDFEAVGGSAAWNARGELVARLSSSDEGALLLDTATDVPTLIERQSPLSAGPAPG